MRRRALSTIFAAAFFAVTVTAAGQAAPLIQLSGNTPNVKLPDIGVATPVQVPECADGLDNDGDTKADLADPDCASTLGANEGKPALIDGASLGAGGGQGGKRHRRKHRRHHRHGHAVAGPGGVIEWVPDNGRGMQVGSRGARDPDAIEPRPIRNADGSPTSFNPSLTLADFGPAPRGVPNFIIDQFEIPPFLLPIYQACGTQYGIPWQVLASINKIETAFGTNLNVSSAGAVGWMQFMPSTWESWGVDANKDRVKDPYNPVDAICAAARYLRAAGGNRDLRTAIFAYNHADWYVDEVLVGARAYGKLPDDLIGSLTGLTEGAVFPVAARARYADDISEREAVRRAKSRQGVSGNVADIYSSNPKRRSIDIFSRRGAPVVAVNDGVIQKIGHSAERGNYVVFQDAYGNRYTYSNLGAVAARYPAPKEKRLTAKDFELVKPKADRKPNAPASAGLRRRPGIHVRKQLARAGQGPSAPANRESLADRFSTLVQLPQQAAGDQLNGKLDKLLGNRVPAYTTFRGYLSRVFQFDPRTTVLKPLRKGSKVVGGTVLGRLGPAQGGIAPHVTFEIRPAGRGAPLIDPKPILDGWKLLADTALYRVAGKNPLIGGASVGQVLLMSKTSLERRVLADPHVEIYSCGRDDIQSGQVDRRVLATIEYLAARGFRLTLTSLKCGHSFLTASGNVSEHSSGNAMDIALVNGIPIIGHQGGGSITESVIKELLKLQGPMRPHQIISLMKMGPPTFAMADHADHIHVGFQPLFGDTKLGKQFARLLKPEQWQRLIGRIAKIPQPNVRTKASKYSIPVKRHTPTAD
jgi:transglycosylase-like protein with SLT domain